MSTAAIKPKGPRVIPTDRGPTAWASTYLGSTVGSKIVVALTGLGLVGFVLFHMVGNLKILYGRESINAYAYFLKHSLGPYLWAARAGLLAIFVTHIALTLRLKYKAAKARPVGYVYQRTAQATLQSRTMLLTGIVIGLFTSFHLAHYTFGWVTTADLGNGRHVNYLDLTETTADGTVRHDVYSMVVAGFSTPWLTLLYIVAQLFLFAHLAHGIQSTIQTLGLKGTRFAPAWVGLGYATAVLIVAGNLAIVVAVWAGALEPVYPMAR